MKHFVDIATFEVKAGDGGNGAVSFRREKYIPRGGPDGGDGGNGGSIYAKATSALSTLYDFTHRHKFVSEDGEHGGKAQKSGKSGNDIVLKFPIGTIIYEHQYPNTSEAKLVKIADLDEDNETTLLVKGGRGGRGNVNFKSATNQTPDYATPGTPGGHKVIVVELKTVADIGLIGLPNAGKSTLLSRLTNAKPEIAAYPFTTLSPNLGIMEYRNQRIVIADIPGLIEGAAQGKGLGDDFLRHVERTRVLVHLIDPLFQDPIQAYQTIRKELGEYSPLLLEKKELIVLTKVDITEVKDSINQILERFNKELGRNEVVFISAATGEGIDTLQDRVEKLVAADRLQAPSAEEKAKQKNSEIPVFTLNDLKSR
ncbi:GTPase ObgE [candidate division WWE3 bacterium]|nr:GTPase ObgE [candidate division WWE3 bacterium]